MPWPVCHNPEIDWRIGKIKMTRCPEEYGKQWRPEQRKSGWQKQKQKEAKAEAGRKQEGREKRKQRGNKMVEIKRVAKEWKI